MSERTRLQRRGPRVCARSGRGSERSRPPAPRSAPRDRRRQATPGLPGPLRRWPSRAGGEPVRHLPGPWKHLPMPDGLAQLSDAWRSGLARRAGVTPMQAIVIEGGKGPPEALHLGEIETPTPAPGQILIRIEAAGVNRPDVIQRLGFYPPPPGAPATMGLEVAGEVTHGAGRWKAGDRVCALLGGGGYAEYAVC